MIVHFLENNGNNKCETAKEFDIESKQVHEQSNNKVKLLVTAPYVIKLHSDKPVKYSSLEDDLYAQICERRNNQNAITRKIITSKAISLSKT